MRQQPFVSTFCDVRLIPDHFKGQLGRFTPCFTDIVVLGSAHLCAVVLCTLRLAQLGRTQGGSPRYRLTGASKAAHVAAAVLSIACLLVVLFQLNARLAAEPYPLASGGAAPFEWAGYTLALLSWALFAAVFLRELTRYNPKGTALWRFPLFLIFAGQLAKLTFVIELSDPHHGGVRGYFFYLFLVYVALQAALAALAALHFPQLEQQEPTAVLGEECGYQLLAPDADSSRHEPEGVKACPEASAGLLSRLTFSWMSALMARGFRAPLRQEDVWGLPTIDRVKSLSRTFEREWRQEQDGAAAKREDPSLIRACWRSTAPLFLWALPWKLAADGATFVGPVFMRLLLGVVGEEEAAGSSVGRAWRGYAYAGAMLAGLLVGVIADNQHFQRVMRAGFRLRSMLTAAVVQKVLTMSPADRAQFSSGRLYSAVGSDVDTIQQLCMSLLGLVSTPIRIVGALWLLHAQLGAAAWVTLGLLAALMPVQTFMVRKAAAVTRHNMAHTDERSKLEGELVGGIDVVKCYAWEESFMSRVLGVRTLELKGIWKAAVIAGVNTSLIHAVPVLAALGSFGAYSLLSSQPLTAAQAFTSLTLLGILQVPLFQLPMLVVGLVSAKVAMGRLQGVLAAEEQPPLPILPPAAPGEVALRLEGDFTWDIDSPPSLVDLAFEVPAGALVAVVGSTGSGKSSLLSAAIGLMVQVEGPTPKLRGAAAYAAQAAFIVNDTVRANILFGREYDEEKYRHAVAAACLQHDLEQLPGGDLTELGDRGVNVSGGQKQRIALARAAYSGADVLLLDDVLSALDAKVGRRVFRDCILGEMSGKTRVLVTNQLQFAKSADLVAFMAEGKVAEFGTYQDLLRAGGGFAAAMAQALAEGDEGEEDLGGDDAKGDGSAPEAPEDAGTAAAHARAGGAAATSDEGGSVAAAAEDASGSGSSIAAGPPSMAGPFAAATAAASRSGDGAGRGGRTGVAAAPSTAPSAADPPNPATLASSAAAAAASSKGRLTADEGVSQGAVSAAVVWAYVAAMGGAMAAAAVLGALASVECARVGAQLWLQHWTQDVDAAAGGPTPHPTPWYLGIYASLAGAQILFTLSSQFLTKHRALAASNVLHANMLSRLLRAPMAFFNTTPLGRIVNRLTKDTADVDRTLPDFAAFYLRSLLQLCSTLALVGALNPFTLWALTPCMLGFYLLYAYFQATVREVKRLDAVSRSPLLGCVGEAVGGLPSIRAYRAEGRLMERCRELLDAHIVFSLVNQSANRWLSIRLESLGAFAAFAAAVLAVEQRGAAAVVGNILSAALSITQLVSMTVRAASLAELSFNAVERVEEYCKLPQEAAAVVPGSAPEGWPAKGEIKFGGVRMRYRPGLPLVLKGLTFEVPGGSSCGVVGRTGAGKSSLIGALFRLVEVEGGHILLDGVDTRRVGLSQLRGAMALIPQAPVLFTGTIRFNLSPFGQHSDSELWAALRRAHLAPAIQASNLGLDMVVSEGGAPLSAGQKQLLALARALLRHSRVLILDEATANVDLETDALIQKTVRSEFIGCTTLAVAHRLHTVIDCDSVLVMDGGRAAEHGPAAQLLSMPGGIFADMVRETGEATERLLRQLAAGEAQAQGSLDAKAQLALQRLLSAPREGEEAGLPPGECAYRLSKELEASAAGAATAVRAALEAMRETSDYVEGGVTDPAAAVAISLRHAFQLVEQVRRLAERAQQRAPRPMGCEDHPPSALPGAPGPPLRGRPPLLELPGSFSGDQQGGGGALGSAASWPLVAAAGGAGGRTGGDERSPLLQRRSSVSVRGGGSGTRPLLSRSSSSRKWGEAVVDAVLGAVGPVGQQGDPKRRLLRMEDPCMAQNPELR